MRALIVPLAAVVALAACGEEDRAAPAQPRTVALSVDLERQVAGPPDGGQDQGHGGDAVSGRASGASFAFTGRVRPAGASVRVVDPRRRVKARVSGGRRFEVRLAGLAPGTNRLRLTARADAHRPRTIELRILR